jgi:uncharacterized membrane protein YfbV (UPF0208 family)
MYTVLFNEKYKIIFQLIYFYTMDKQKIKEQEDKLKELAKKPVSKEIAESIKQKQYGLKNTFTK